MRGIKKSEASDAFLPIWRAAGVHLDRGGQVISDSLIGFFDIDSRSKALCEKLPNFDSCPVLL